MAKIDLHIIYNPFVCAEWRIQCLKSVEKYEEHCNIFLTDYLSTNFESRKHGYAKGTSEYVSFVDIDDILTDDINIPMLLEPLKNKNIVGVFTNSYILDDQGLTTSFYNKSIKSWNRKRELEYGFPAHQFLIMRRDLTMQFYDTVNLDDYGIDAAWADPMMHGWITQFGDWHYFPVHNYIWRRHGNGLHTTAQHTRTQLMDYYKTLINI